MYIAYPMVYSQSLLDNINEEKKQLSEKIERGEKYIQSLKDELDKMTEAYKLLDAVVQYSAGKQPAEAPNDPPQCIKDDTIKDRCFIILTENNGPMKLGDILDKLQLAGKKFSLNGVRSAINTLTSANKIQKVGHGRYQVCIETAKE